MKKIKFFVVAALLTISSGVNAQFSSSQSKSISTNDSSGEWSSVWLEYNAVNIDFNQGIDDETTTGFSAGFSKAYSITAGTPLFLEAGLGVQYFTKSDFLDTDDVNFSMISAKVPVNLIYEFYLPNSNIKIDPFVGLTFRYNITGTISNDKDDKNIFDKDDMGSSDYTFKRFQAGWQVGVKARFGGGFSAGIAYGSDFSNIWEPKVQGGSKVKANVGMTTLTIGYSF